ncbi:hypothetical protein, partial [Klebsiella pneumoniae]|uniref:hypothetical protein n=1 Tax=Klebsiella pneumoniae TaxID=573 RepID=UPI001F4B6769
GTDNADQEQGVGFWFDDYQGVTGTITAFLDDYDYSECFLQVKNAEGCSEKYIGLQLIFYINWNCLFSQKKERFSVYNFLL